MVNRLASKLTGKLFDALREHLMRTQRGRWVLGALFLVIAALCAVLAFASHATSTAQTIGFAIGAAFFLALALLVLVGNALIGRQRRQVGTVVAESEARAKQMLAEGTLLPIPALPKNPPAGASAEDLAQVETNAAQLREIPWGDHIEVQQDQARAAFDSALAEVRHISGDWTRLRGPIHVFAGLPRPLCHVGAAEVMFRLSYLQGTTYAPVGLRQGLRFATRAQFHTPLQPDALIVQLRLLAACRAPTWQELATKTLGMIQRVASDHPRLPQAEMFYHRMRGEYEQALVCADRALAADASPQDQAATLSSKAVLLMSLKRNEEAAETLRAALALNPNDPWLWHNTSLALTALGRYQEALQCSERALSLMEFGVARAQRDKLLRLLAEQGNAQAR